MKITTGLIVGLILGVLLIAIVGLFFFLNNVLNVFQSAAVPTIAATASPTSTASSAAITPTPTPTSVTGSLTPGAALVPTVSIPTTVTPTASPTPVVTSDIKMEILSAEGSGFNQTVTGQFTNSGTTDLHNAKLKIEMFSKSKLIKNGSQDYIEKSFGTMKAGAAVIETVSIKVSAMDGIYVKMNGITFVLSFTSDEKYQTIKLEYDP